MPEKRLEPQKISMASTKRDMLEAYNVALKQLQDQRKSELRPERKLEEKRKKEVVELADSLSSEGVVKGASNLKLEIGKMLTQISDKLEEEVSKFKGIQKAIDVKENELQEVYEIERSAATLAALIESHNQKRLEFQSEMATTEEELRLEIEETRAEWEKDKRDHLRLTKERDTEEKKRHDRDKEQFTYALEREQQLLKDTFEDEKAKLEKEIRLKREEMEKEGAEREKAIAEKEDELIELRMKVTAFPKEMETAINKAVKETSERINLETKSRAELLEKEFDGQRNVLSTRIESLDKTVREQSEQIAKLSQQLEKAYQKVQDIALKAVEGSSNLKSFASFQQLSNEQTRKQSQER